VGLNSLKSLNLTNVYPNNNKNNNNNNKNNKNYKVKSKPLELRSRVKIKTNSKQNFKRFLRRPLTAFFASTLLPDSTVSFPPNSNSNYRYGVTQSLWESHNTSTLGGGRGARLKVFFSSDEAVTRFSQLFETFDLYYSAI
jgi:hypothetical protein